VQLERKAAYRATVREVGPDKLGAVAVKQREDPLARIVDPLPRRAQQPLVDPIAISLENRDQQLLLAGKEMIEAAAVDLGAAEDVGDRGRLKPLGPEQVQRRPDDPVARIGVHPFAPQST
jgi:hypothetical protein